MTFLKSLYRKKRKNETFIRYISYLLHLWMGLLSCIVVKVVGSSSPLLKLTLIHEPASASEAQNGTSWGSVSGGETDAEGTFGLTN